MLPRDERSVSGIELDLHDSVKSKIVGLKLLCEGFTHALQTNDPIRAAVVAPTPETIQSSVGSSGRSTVRRCAAAR